jgi:mevalonate kinase
VGGLGRASGKLLLFGEHAAVYGHRAVGISLPETTTVLLAGETGSWDLARVPADDREMVLAILARLEELLPELAARGRCGVQIDSTVARGVGFGSSAALCGALARAALVHAGAAAEQEDRAWRLAHDAERLFHGTPSGIDTGLALVNGMHAFLPRAPRLPAREPLFAAPVHLVVAAVPRAEGCGVLVGAIGERMRAGEPGTLTSIGMLGSCAEQAREVLRGDGPDRDGLLGGCADRAMETLRRLGLSTPGLDRLLAAGCAEGALGGKLSGAGGGGAFFLVARDAGSAEGIAERVRSQARSGGIPLASKPRHIVAGGQR